MLAGRAFADEPPAPFDPVGQKARVDLLGPFRADAVNPTPVKPAPAIGTNPISPSPEGSVAPGGACTKDSECSGRAYCDLGKCIQLQRRTSALIYYHQPGDKGYRFVVPIYWHWWSHDGNGRIVFPLYWHFHDYKTAEEDTFFLLYQHHKDPDVNSHRIWPIFFFSRYGEGGRDGSGAGLIPIFWASRNKTKTIGVAPLLLTGWSHDSATGDYNVFAIHSFFSRHGEKTFGTVFPLFWHSGDAKSSTNVILPLALWGHDDNTGSSHATVAPLFHWQSNSKTHRKLLLTLLGAYTQNDDDQVHQFVGFAPPIYHRRDPQREVDMVLPIAVRWHDKIDRTTTTIAGPYIGHTDPSGSTTVVFPLAWIFDDSVHHSSTAFLLPFGVFHESPRENGAIVGPFYRYVNQNGWAGGLFPLLFLQKMGGREHQALFPLFLHARDRNAGTETTAVGPAFYRTKRDGWDFGLLPLVFAGRHADQKYGVGFPLYVYRGDKTSTTHVLGPLYASKSDNGYAGGLAPIIHFGARRDATGVTHTSWILPPLYVHTDDSHTDSSFSLIALAFHSHSGTDKTSGFFPLVWDVDRGPKHAFVVFPFGGRLVDDEQKTSQLWIGPFIRLKDEKAQTTTSILIPLGVKHDAPDYHVLVQFPFFWRIKDGDETSTVVFPFYARTRRPDLAADILFPIFWRFRGEKSSTTVLATGFWHSTPERTDAALLPIGGFGKGGGKSYAWVLPLLFYHSSDEKAGTNRTLFTLFLWDRRPDGWTSAFIPIYAAWRRDTRTSFVGPFFYRHEDTADGTQLDVVGPFYYGSNPHRHIAGLVPLIFTSTHDDGRWNATFLPLFTAAHKADGGTRFFTLLGGFSTDPTGARGFVGPFYFRKDNAGYSTALIPIFFHSYDRIADSSTTLLFPLFFRSATPEKSITAITPLGWRYSGIESSFTLAFPLFFDRHAYAESRTTGFIPLYIRHKNKVDGSLTQVFPLFYVHTGEKQPTDVVLFPIFWHLHGLEGSRTTMLFPVFWDFRRGTSKTQVLFPLYMHAVRDDADYTLVLNLFYRRGKGPREGSYYVNIFPLLSFGRPRVQDLEWDFLGGLFGYSRVGRNRTLKLLFGLEIALDPAPLAATSSGTMFTSNPTNRGGLF